jgi:small subunit ribosomal protein S1
MSKIKRAYTRDEYSPEEREILDRLYEGHYQKNFVDKSIDFTSKELEDNQVLRVKITSIKNNTAIGESSVGQSVSLDLLKEEKAINKLGFPPLQIVEGSEIDVVIFKDRSGVYNGSLAAGYENTLKNELLTAIKEEKTAYPCKIESTCNGGFMVNLSGIKCFLPGSLAAANRIIDFQSFVGKTVNVMVETYDEKRDIFVVSFKKYLKNIINSKVQELSLTQIYTGTITGTSAAGVFVEWDEYYTGLIPAEEFEVNGVKMDNEPGDSVSFYVNDFKNPSRIVLKLTPPGDKDRELQELKHISLQEDRENKIYTGIVSKIKNFGVFVKLENGITGLIERDFLARNPKDYVVEEKINFTVLDVELQSSKLYLKEKIENT